MSNKKTAVEDTAIATREEQSGELQRTGSEARATAEVQASMAIAKRFPRNELAAFGKAMESMKRPSMAAIAKYSFPRGGSKIEGPTVYLMRELARLWGNIDHGFVIVEDDAEIRHVRAIAWDLETNTRVVQDAVFKKLIYRKKEGWVVPDERDLRELTNRQGAIAERNCIKHVLPADLTEDALAAAAETMRLEVKRDPSASLKKLVTAFGSMGIGVEALEAHLSHPLKECTEAEIVSLREVYSGIKSGDAKWSELAGKKEQPQVVKGDTTVDDLIGTDDKVPLERPQDAMANLDFSEFARLLAKCRTVRELNELRDAWLKRAEAEGDRLKIDSMVDERIQELEDKPAPGKQKTAFEKSERA